MRGSPFFIVRTRFSVASDKWPGFVPDNSWLDFRIDLLKKCAMGAMDRQTYRKYVWLIEVSPETKDYVRERLDNCNHVNGHVVTSKGGSGEGFRRLGDNALKLIPDSDQYAVTRLDSDDVFHPRTLEIFSRHLNHDIPLVGIERGYKFDWMSGHMYLHHYHHSAFFALLSQDKNGVIGPGGHKTIRRHYNHISLVDIPFIQIIHHTNVRAGIVKDDEELEPAKRDQTLAYYGVKWDPSVPPPSGQSNPKVALKDWLEKDHRQERKSGFVGKIFGKLKSFQGRPRSL